MSGIKYIGTWDANSNNPAIVSSIGITGNYYNIIVAGNTNIDNISNWNCGDLIIFNGNTWAKISSSDNLITSVAGKTGTVILNKNDVSLNNVDNTSDLNKPVSNATQTLLNNKQNTLVSGTNIKTINNNSLLGSGNISIIPKLDIASSFFNTGMAPGSLFRWNNTNAITTNVTFNKDSDHYISLDKPGTYYIKYNGLYNANGSTVYDIAIQASDKLGYNFYNISSVIPLGAIDWTVVSYQNTVVKTVDATNMPLRIKIYQQRQSGFYSDLSLMSAVIEIWTLS